MQSKFLICTDDTSPIECECRKCQMIIVLEKDDFTSTVKVIPKSYVILHLPVNVIKLIGKWEVGLLWLKYQQKDVMRFV